MIGPVATEKRLARRPRRGQGLRPAPRAAHPPLRGGLDPAGELLQQVSRDVLHQVAPELSRTAGDGKVGLDDEARAAFLRDEVIRNRRSGAAVPSPLAPLDVEARDVLVLVDVLESRAPLVLHRDRAKAHLERAAVNALGALGLDGRSGESAHQARNVEEERPRPLERRGHDNLVPQLHVIPPSR